MLLSRGVAERAEKIIFINRFSPFSAHLTLLREIKYFCLMKILKFTKKTFLINRLMPFSADSAPLREKIINLLDFLNSWLILESLSSGSVQPTW